MARRSSRTSDDDAARGVIDGLFLHPPINDAELDRRLRAIDHGKARKLLAERLEKGEVKEDDGALLVAAFSRIGVGQQTGALIALAIDRDIDPHRRAQAMTVLLASGPEQRDALLGRLSPEDGIALAELSLIDLLSAVQVDPAQAEMVTSALEGVPRDARDELLRRLEQCRRRTGVPASLVYAHALRSERLAALRPVMVDALIDEAGPDAERLVQQLRDEATDARVRLDHQRTLLRLLTRRIEPGHRVVPLGGFAYVGTCDGQGSFIVIGCFENPDSTYTMANLCLRAAGDLRDGYVLPRQSAAVAEQLVGEMSGSSGSTFVRIALLDAAPLVMSAVDRTREMGLDIPDEAIPAAALFKRVLEIAEDEENEEPPAGAADAPTPIVDKTHAKKQRRSAKAKRAPGAVAAEDEVGALLARPELASWYFDAGDLEAARLRPAAKLPKAAIARALGHLAASPVRTQLASMAEHMSRWYAWKGETALSVLCARLAADTAERFADSALARAMLERSIRLASEALNSPRVNAFGNPVVRQHLKALFFHDVEEPKGKDLARLDLTEAARSCMSESFDGLPGHRRPREDERDAAAHAVGKIYADYVVSGRDEKSDRLLSRIDQAVGSVCRLSADERLSVIDRAIPALEAFVEQICASCPVKCLDRARASVADAFFSPEHPTYRSPP